MKVHLVAHQLLPPWLSQGRRTQWQSSLILCGSRPCLHYGELCEGLSSFTMRTLCSCTNRGPHRPRWQHSGAGSSAALRRIAIEWTKIQNRLRKRQESRLKSKKEVHHSNVFHFTSRDPESFRIAMSVRTMSTFWRRSLLKLIVHLTC